MVISLLSPRRRFAGCPLSASALRLQPDFEVPLVVAVNAATRAAVLVIRGE